MQRWFFADEQIVCKEPTPPSPPSTTSPTTSETSFLEREWTFNICFREALCSNETVAIIGNIPELGNWKPSKSVPLIENKSLSCWTLKINLPLKTDIRYRYLVCALNPNGQKIVRFWETHFEARLIKAYQYQNMDSIEYDTFGILNNKRKVERGWLNPYNLVLQFKIYQAPFVLKVNIENPLINVKVTPIKIKEVEKCKKELVDNLMQQQNEDKELSYGFAFCEVSSLLDSDGAFHKQQEYGTSCGSDDFLIFNLTLGNLEHTAFLIDFYNYAPKSGSDVPPYHIGYHYVYPEMLQGSEGALQLTTMCTTTHRPIGCMNVEYLIVKPLGTHDFILEKTFQRHYNSKHKGEDIGHRGCGPSFRWQNNILRENTINSLNLAFEHGAEVVEFDVQLTKDKIPILYHDFQLYLPNSSFTKDPQEYDEMHLPLTALEYSKLVRPFLRNIGQTFKSLPLCKLTLEQLKRVKVFQPPQSPGPCFNDTTTNQPFTTLAEAFQKVNSKAKFLIDIKWPQKFKDGTFQEDFNPELDKNEYVDAILRVVLDKSETRRIIFCSYDADICTMVRLKQNIYPIMFKIHDDQSEKEFLEPRGLNTVTGCYFANAMEILGITCNCKDILKTPGIVSDVHDKDLCLFSWGKQRLTEETRKYFQTLGVDAVICDRVNHVEKPKDLKHNIFYIDLIGGRESKQIDKKIGI